MIPVATHPGMLLAVAYALAGFTIYVHALVRA
jgi:hypothetical protein